MTWAAALADGLWVPPGSVCPDVGWFLPRISVLAVTYGMAGESLHERHLAELTHGIFYEPPGWVYLFDKAQSGLYELHCKPRGVCLRCVVIVPVASYVHDGESLAGWACPEDVNRVWQHRSVEGTYVCYEIREVCGIVLYGKGLVSEFFGYVAKRSSARKQL